MTALVWGVLAVFTLGLIVMTWQVLTHRPDECQVCLVREEAARLRHPSSRDLPDWLD